MKIEKTFQGAWKISDIIDGYLETMQYMGYTKEQAIEKWNQKQKENQEIKKILQVRNERLQKEGWVEAI